MKTSLWTPLWLIKFRRDQPFRIPSFTCESETETHRPRRYWYPATAERALFHARLRPNNRSPRTLLGFLQRKPRQSRKKPQDPGTKTPAVVPSPVFVRRKAETKIKITSGAGERGGDAPRAWWWKCGDNAERHRPYTLTAMGRVPAPCA